MPRNPPPAGDVRYKLGDVIKTRRIARGLTQRELANVVGLSFTLVGYYEQGRREPGIANLLRLARACDMPLSAYLSLLDSVEVPERAGAIYREPRRVRKKKVPDEP